MITKRTLLAFLLSLTLYVPQLQAQDYDIVILNGRVMDPETEFDQVRNVGIKDGKIVTITEKAIQGQGNSRMPRITSSLPDSSTRTRTRATSSPSG